MIMLLRPQLIDNPSQGLSGGPWLQSHSGDPWRSNQFSRGPRYSSTGGGLAPVHGRNLLFQMRKNKGIDVK